MCSFHYSFIPFIGCEFLLRELQIVFRLAARYKTCLIKGAFLFEITLMGVPARVLNLIWKKAYNHATKFFFVQYL
jgi:hypothetical protein